MFTGGNGPRCLLEEPDQGVFFRVKEGFFEEEAGGSEAGSVVPAGKHLQNLCTTPRRAGVGKGTGCRESADAGGLLNTGGGHG